jgi:5-methylcytosine-specific restriction endonuclease McrA
VLLHDGSAPHRRGAKSYESLGVRKSSGIPYVNSAACVDDKKRERDAFYSSKAWIWLRDAFLAANPLCGRCEAKGLTVIARVVHHIKERLKFPELALDWDNLEGLCNPCHSTEHAKRRNKT